MALGDFMNQAALQQLGSMSSFYQDKDKERSRQSDEMEKLKLQQQHQKDLQDLMHKHQLQQAEHAERIKQKSLEDELERQKRQTLTPEQEDYQRSQLGLPARTNPDAKIDLGEHQGTLDSPMSLGGDMRTQGLGGGGAYNASNPYMTGGVMPGEGQGLMGQMRGQTPPRSFAYQPMGPSLMGGESLQRPQAMPQTLPQRPMSMFEVNQYKAMQTRKETPEERRERELQRQALIDYDKMVEASRRREFQGAEGKQNREGRERVATILSSSATQRNRESIKSREGMHDATLKNRLKLAEMRIAEISRATKDQAMRDELDAITREMGQISQRAATSLKGISPEDDERLGDLEVQLDNLKARAKRASTGRASTSTKRSASAPAFTLEGEEGEGSQSQSKINSLIKLLPPKQ